MDLEIGIVCGRCETYAVIGTATCVSCGHALAPGDGRGAGRELRSRDHARRVRAPAARHPGGAGTAERTPREAPTSFRRPAPRLPPGRRPHRLPAHRIPCAARSRASIRAPNPRIPSPPPRSSRAGMASSQSPGYPTPAKSSKGKSVEELMDQAKNFVCRSCSTAVPLGHKFCGRCGAAVPAGDPAGPHAVLRAAPGARQGEADPDPRRGRRGPQLPAQRRAAHRRPQRPARLPRRPVRLAEARELLLPKRQARRARRGLAQRRLPPRARAPSTSSRTTSSSPASRSSASTRRRSRTISPAPTARTSTRRRSTRARSASRRCSRAAPPA